MINHPRARDDNIERLTGHHHHVSAMRDIIANQHEQLAQFSAVVGHIPSVDVEILKVAVGDRFLQTCVEAAKGLVGVAGCEVRTES